MLSLLGVLCLMPKDISIVQNEHPDEGETDFIYQQLRTFNTLHTGKLPRKSIRLFAYNPEGRVVGGLFGDVGWYCSSDHFQTRPKLCEG